ncbi:MAG: copper-binding protein [Ideonella sp.]|nr:copper-binding protein [Ideonella sp.]MCC7456495.1 copper-binding protein [Nitrospira sp.]
MKNPLIVIAIAAGAFAGPALAQLNAADHAAHHPAATDAVLTDGEIRKVDKAAGKLTIKHGEIRNLDMPPMTMVFQVKSAALLDQLKAGDKVRFHVEKAASGYVVTTIERAP